MDRRLPIGAELVPEGLHVRVWAPTHPRVTLVLESPERREVALRPTPGGYHEALVDEVAPGARYRFRLGEVDQRVPDPASRFQPEGPFGPSEVIDPGRFEWTDRRWQGIEPHRHVLYELHVGTFTPEGTWTSATAALGYLADLGITTIELMPIADFPGHHNWGYDGVDLFAPCHAYGHPDDLRRFVDRSHALGLAVILDVVYNHLGPSGNFLFQWCPYYRGARPTEWGEAIAFDGPHSAGVREYFVANAGYWIAEYHLDGLRLDATQTIVDRSPEHVIAQIARRAREAGAGRRIFLIAENEPQRVELLGAGFELDALWNDDFHHAARVALTGAIDGYLHDHRGTPQELVSAVKRGFLFQGQHHAWQRQARGSSTRGVSPTRFVHYLENHDQIANLGFGERLAALVDPGKLRALTALLLLSPQLPLVFQGQETGERTPWRYFVDHGAELANPIRRGRAEFVAQFARLATAESQAAQADPCDPATFAESILDPAARVDSATLRLHRDLLRLRRDDPAFGDARRGVLDGAVLSDHAFALRYLRDDPADDRLILVNLGPAVHRGSIPEPLIAPPADCAWRLAWSSEHPGYGGHGTPPVFAAHHVAIPAHAAVVLAAVVLAAAPRGSS